MMRVKNYNQGDPLWGDIVFAITPQGEPMTIRRWGCLGTAITNALANYAIELTPAAFFAKSIAYGAFDAQGYFDASKLPKMFPNVLNLERSNTTNVAGGTLQPDAAVNKIKSLIAAGQPVVVWVDNIKPEGEPDHWVCIKEWKNNDFLINNPDGGLEQWFSIRYGDPLKKIYGFLALAGQAVDVPDSSSDSDKKRSQAIGKAARLKTDFENLPRKVKDQLPYTFQTYAKEILDSLV